MEYTFKIPHLPPSLNQIYQIIYAHRIVQLSTEARAFKNAAKTFMPAMKFPEGAMFEVKVEVHKDWYLKGDRSKLKRQDLSNLEKLLFDTLFEHLGRDDKALIAYHLSKVQQEDKKEYLIVSIKDVNELKCE